MYSPDLSRQPASPSCNRKSGVIPIALQVSATRMYVRCIVSPLTTSNVYMHLGQIDFTATFPATCRNINTGRLCFGNVTSRSILVGARIIPVQYFHARAWPSSICFVFSALQFSMLAHVKVCSCGLQCLYLLSKYSVCTYIHTTYICMIV